MSETNNALNVFINQCHNILINSKFSIPLQYLNTRGLNEESIALHKIGYCPINLDIPEEIRYDKQNDYSYFLKDRIIVPVLSEFSNIVGFATRKPSYEPNNTWWNFPFKKGNHLFLLNKSRKNVFNKNKMYLVEGYMDALVLYQYGLNNVCGLMGTMLSQRKIGLLARYCNNVCLCFDSDKNEAGQKAQNKAIYMFKEFDFCESISVIDLPIGIDPDNYIIENGMDKFLSLERKMSDIEINKVHRLVKSEMKK
jgi:DNA primase